MEDPFKGLGHSVHSEILLNLRVRSLNFQILTQTLGMLGGGALGMLRHVFDVYMDVYGSRSGA